MTNEERYIAVLNRLLESMNVYDSVQPTTERKKAIKAAIQALSQEPCERFEWGIDGNVYKITKAKDGKEICQQVCNDAISRDAVCNIVNDIRDCISVEGYCAIIERLKKLPALTQKYGKWIHISGDEWVCSECGEVITTEGSWDKPMDIYCKECGSKMQESEETE